MRVAFLAPDLHHGHGWGHYSISLVRALAAQGVDPVVLAATNTPSVPDLPVYPLLPTVSPAEPRQLAKMGLLALRTRQHIQSCDLVHALLEPYAPLAQWASGGKPYLITGHGSYAQPGIDRHAAVRRVHVAAFRGAWRVVCVSHYTEQRAKAHIPDLRTAVVHNGIDPARFAHLPPLPDAPKRPVVLTSGGIKERKGTLQLVRAIAAVREHIPDVLCVVIGATHREPDYTAQVQAAIEELRLQNHVWLLGFVPEETLLGWYGAADVFVLPSMNSGGKFEGYGLVHLEASAAGLPVIGTRDCGAEDVIEHDVTGLLVGQQQIDAELPAAVLKLLRDPQRARLMGAAGKQKAQYQTWDAAAGQMLALYQQALAGRAHGKR